MDNMIVEALVGLGQLTLIVIGVALAIGFWHLVKDAFRGKR